MRNLDEVVSLSYVPTYFTFLFKIHAKLPMERMYRFDLDYKSHQQLMLLPKSVSKLSKLLLTTNVSFCVTKQLVFVHASLYN